MIVLLVWTIQAVAILAIVAFAHSLYEELTKLLSRKPVEPKLTDEYRNKYIPNVYDIITLNTSSSTVNDFVMEIENLLRQDKFSELDDFIDWNFAVVQSLSSLALYKDEAYAETVEKLLAHAEHLIIIHNEYLARVANERLEVEVEMLKKQA